MRRVLLIIYYSFLFSLLFPCRVNAYIDPSVTTYAIQALAGIIIGLSAFINIYWRRIARKLNIGSSIYTNYESDRLYYHDPVSGEHTELDYPEVKVSGGSFTKLDILSSFFIIFFFLYLLIIYAPVDMYNSNRNEFWFDFPILIKAALPTFFLFLCIFLIVLFIIRRFSVKGFRILCTVIFTVFIILYIQGSFLVSHMPPMDGTTPVWSEYHTDMIISILLTVIAVIAVVYGSTLLKEKMQILMAAISFLIALALGITDMTMVFTTNILDQKIHCIISENNYTVLSPKKNFIIFLLDAVDSRMIQQLMDENPQFYKENFSDFTYYPDTSATYSFTQESVPFIMNGKWFENQEDFHDFQIQAMAESPLLQRLEKEDWLIDYYDHDLMYLTDEETIKRYRNAYQYETKFSSLSGYIQAELKLVLFKYAPFYLKPLIHFDPDEFLSLRNLPEGMTGNAFNLSDIHFHEQMNSVGFTISDETTSNFKFYHLDGAHTPFEYDEDMNVIERGKGDFRTDVIVSMKVAAELIKELKKTEVYNDTAVIILSDHGYGYQNTGYIFERANPILFIKGYQEKHDFEISRAPISFSDLQDLYNALLNGQTGSDVFKWKEGDIRQRRLLAYYYNQEYTMQEFYLEGNASDMENYHPTGTVFELQK